MLPLDYSNRYAVDSQIKDPCVPTELLLLKWLENVC